MSEHLLEVYATIGFTLVQGLFTSPDSVIDEIKEIADQIRAANADPLQSIRDEIAALKSQLGKNSVGTELDSAVEAAADAAVADPAPTPDDVGASAVEVVKKKIFSPRGQNGMKGGGKSLRQFMGIAD